MKRILLVGSVGCGKTTLLQRLHGADLTYAKTETIYTDGQVVDTPGEYLELPWFKHALRLASFEVELVVLLASATVSEAKFPPGFTTFFMPPSIGVVTKTDLAGPSAIATAGSHLRLAGATELYEVSAVTGDGIDTLSARLA
ncbi:MAG: EutP/PduV family microcompartment system protein [Propionicimonas sp.]|uniref:EutP/PduV family microcompartment system protein n=1 Tax=Propionicimonas sp. TaxID=1955623 RepID=UPI003D0F0B02